MSQLVIQFWKSENFKAQRGILATGHLNLGILLSLSVTKTSQNFLLNCKFDCELRSSVPRHIEYSVKSRQWFGFPLYKSSCPWSLVASGALYFARGKKSSSIIALSLGASSATHHILKTHLWRASFLFLFHYPQIDLEYKAVSDGCNTNILWAW